MDLRERAGQTGRRHPWELSRLDAIRFLLRPILSGRSRMTVLDIGCGDAFMSRELRKTAPFLSVTAIDTNLSDKEISDFSGEDEGLRYCNEYGALEGERYDLVLLLDVLEHIRDEGSFLRDIVERHTSSGGYLLVTVPAFQGLYGSHDRFLAHFRRYGRNDLLRLLEEGGFPCLRSGYLFLSLLPLRFFSRIREELRISSKSSKRGVGGWTLGKTATDLVKAWLDLDNRLSMALNRIGLRIPGLTVWAVCRKP